MRVCRVVGAPYLHTHTWQTVRREIPTPGRGAQASAHSSSRRAVTYLRALRRTCCCGCLTPACSCYCFVQLHTAYRTHPQAGHSKCTETSPAVLTHAANVSCSTHEVTVERFM